MVYICMCVHGARECMCVVYMCMVHVYVWCMYVHMCVGGESMAHVFVHGACLCMMHACVCACTYMWRTEDISGVVPQALSTFIEIGSPTDPRLNTQAMLADQGAAGFHMPLTL